VIADDICGLSLGAARDAIAARELSALEVTEAAIGQAERFDSEFGLFITPDYERALEAAKAADGRGAVGDLPRLHGVPITIKDNIDTAGLRTTAGARVHADRVPAEDATVVSRLLAAGAISLGKTNMHEMALGGTSDNPHYGPVHNPWAPGFIPGGSSGGSAAAVSLQVGYASLGTDSGGSVRMPAHFCGQVGLKQTHGAVSLKGCMPTGTGHTDHIGVHARSVADAREVFSVMAGYDPLDAHSSSRPLVPFERAVDPAALRIGVPREYFWDNLDPEVDSVCRAALLAMERQGASLVDVPFATGALLPLARAAGMAEGFIYHEPYLKSRLLDYGEDIRYRLLAGEFVLAHDYIRAMRVRRLVQEEMARLLATIDVLAMPTVPVPAFPIPSLSGGAGTPPNVMVMLQNTMVFNQTGHPAISIPAGHTAAGLPVGLMLAATAFHDYRLLAAAEAFEAVLGVTVVPPILRKTEVAA
jgi:aspartyl-tRNA(Asn)/glutamyl-tRNA(Gln) amidotransferase subunit A